MLCECRQYVVCLQTVCIVSADSMLCECRQYALCVQTVCCVSAESMPFVCRQYVVCPNGSHIFQPYWIIIRLFYIYIYIYKRHFYEASRSLIISFFILNLFCFIIIIIIIIIITIDLSVFGCCEMSSLLHKCHCALSICVQHNFLGHTETDRQTDINRHVACSSVIPFSTFSNKIVYLRAMLKLLLKLTSVDHSVFLHSYKMF